MTPASLPRRTSARSCIPSFRRMIRVVAADKQPLVVGHKGASVLAPENTLASFALALDVGAPGLECDIRASADGVPVIIHDATVDRTTNGAGEVAELRLDELKKLDASCGMAGFRAEPIPTLDELLSLVAGRAFLALEYKSIDAVAPSEPIVRRHNAQRWCTAWSFSLEILEELRWRVPQLSRTQNIGRIESWEECLDRARGLDCVGVSVSHELVDADRVRRAHARGLVFYAWTANEPAGWRRLIECGVDAIVTDDPSGLLTYLASP